jgi:hypothetical protein
MFYDTGPRDRIDLVMMLHSAARNFDIRMDSRNTWKKFEQRFVWNRVGKARFNKEFVVSRWHDIQHNGIQHNNKYNATLSIMTFSIMTDQC